MWFDYPRAHYVDQAWPQTQRDPPASVSLSAGIEDVFNYTQPAPRFLKLPGEWPRRSNTAQTLPHNRLPLESHSSN